tara:strand:+ start:1621 stop:2541 length:921 start_codon:yes stop_codon:yes gene_type:complete
MIPKSKTETAPNAAAEKKVDTPTSKKSNTVEETITFGSKKIYIRRKEVANHLPKEIRAEAVVKLSSVFVNRQPLRGFKTTEEDIKYLATLLDVGPDDREWSRYVRKFWAELRIPIGFAGMELEVGTDQDGEPLSLMDFIKYNFAKRHPLVSDTLEEMEKSSLVRFYIQDPSKDDKKKNNAVQVAKRADREFIKASDDHVRMQNILRVISNVKVDTLDSEQIENMLFDLKQKSPAKFLKFATDDNLDIRAEISSFIESGVLHKVGGAIVNVDETVGEDMDDAIRVLKNPKRSGLLNTLRLRHKELSK